MADSLYYPLLMAPITKDDGEDDIDRKLDMVNGFVDSFINIRTLAHKTITQSSIRYYVYDMIKEIRGLDMGQLVVKLAQRYNALKDLFNESAPAFLVSYNSSYMHYFLARELYKREDDAGCFDSLLRSRKKDSYILTRIFEADMLDEPSRLSIQSNYDCMANYCLVRRQDYYNLSYDDLQRRLSQLSSYIPELDQNDIPPVKLIESRNIRLRKFAEDEWLKDS